MNEADPNLKVIIGLGKTGMSCIRYLKKQGVNLAVVDSRLDPPCLAELNRDFPKVKTYLGGFDHDVLKKADELIVSPGVALREPAIASCVEKGVKAIGDIELFAKATEAPVLAITGSNGKSTVTSLIGKMLKAAGKNTAVGGNFGVPALELLEQNPDLYVLELSSFQLETLHSLRPEVAIVLNVSQDHMDRYGDLEEYVAAKQKVYLGCQAAVINRNDPLAYANIKLPKKVISFGVDKPEKGHFGIDKDYLMYGDEKLLPLNELKIKGRQNAINALAALALGTIIDLPQNVMIQTLKDFSGLPHRCQWVAKIDGVDWYNDSKGTNVGATKAAIEGLGAEKDGKIVLIAGGIDKGGEFSLLRNSVKKYVKAIVLIGKDAKLIEDALSSSSKILRAGSMKEAVMLAKQEAAEGDTILLSPACTSFDMFDNFEHRGNVFIAEVKAIL